MIIDVQYVILTFPYFFFFYLTSVCCLCHCKKLGTTWLMMVNECETIRFPCLVPGSLAWMVFFIVFLLFPPTCSCCLVVLVKSQTYSSAAGSESTAGPFGGQWWEKVTLKLELSSWLWRKKEKRCDQKSSPLRAPRALLDLTRKKDFSCLLSCSSHVYLEHISHRLRFSVSPPSLHPFVWNRSTVHSLLFSPLSSVLVTFSYILF